MSRIALMKKGGKWFAKNTPVTRYWKYVSWTNPIFTANVKEQDGVYYTLSANHYTDNEPAYKAMDGDTTTSENCWWTNMYGGPTESDPAWWQIKSDKKLKITNIKIHNEVASPVNFGTAIWQGSNDGSDWVNLANITGTNTAGYTTTVSLNPSDGYYYHRLLITASLPSNYASSGVSIQEIELSGYIANETVDKYDYDFTTVENLYYAFKKG